MYGSHRTQKGARWALSVAGAVLCLMVPERKVASSPLPFDLAVEDMSVKQLSSTPMFRTVEIACVVSNRGPGTSKATASIVFSHPGDDGPKILKVVPLPRSMDPGERFQTEAQASAWAAASIPYRCEIHFSGAFAAGDANADNNAAEFTFPKL